MDKCYNDLGCPAVTFDSFWQVYCDLRNKVDDAIPLDVVTSLNQSIFSEPGEDEDAPFTLAHLKAPELDMRNVVDVDEAEVEEDLLAVNFTIEDDQDQLY